VRAGFPSCAFRTVRGCKHCGTVACLGPANYRTCFEEAHTFQGNSVLNIDEPEGKTVNSDSICEHARPLSAVEPVPLAWRMGGKDLKRPGAKSACLRTSRLREKGQLQFSRACQQEACQDAESFAETVSSPVS
jgi:hypothetical protein